MNIDKLLAQRQETNTGCAKAMKRPAAAQRTECPTKRQAPAKAEPTLKKPSSTRSITKRPAVAQVDHGRCTLPKPCKVKQVEPRALPGPSRNCEILSLIKETRARIEAFLGWAMLLRFSLCCEASVTLATQRQLAEVLQVAWPPSHAASCSRGAHVFSRTTSLLHRQCMPQQRTMNRNFRLHVSETPSFRPVRRQRQRSLAQWRPW